MPESVAGREPLNVWTIPNALSVLRLLAVPLFLWLVLGPQEDVAAFVVLVIAGVTDYLDGLVARATGQYSRLGAILDPLADRLTIAATLLGLVLRDFIPWWLVIALILRELMLLAVLPALRARGRVALPVTLVGKAATFCLLWGLPTLLLSTVDGPLGDIALVCGWAFTLWGVFLYWWAGIDYVASVRRLVRDTL